MDQLNHHDYYVARAKSARGLAERAASAAIAKIHAEMANRYECTAAQIAPTLVLVREDIYAN